VKPELSRTGGLLIVAIYSFEGKEPVIDPGAYVHESAQIIGDVVIGESCYVGAGAIVRGDYGSIRIGNRTAIEDGCIIHAPPGETCNIGAEVILGHGAIIHSSVIENHARIAIGAIISVHAVVEEWAVIGDGALVPPNHRVASGKVFLGNPVKVVRAVSDQDKANTRMVVKTYTDLCDRYRAGHRRLSP
jgi:phenylacetic acid degradation protein